MNTKTKMCEKTTQRALGGARWLYLMVLMFVGMLVPQGAWADSSGLEMVLIGDKNYYVLRSSADWDKFRQLVIDAQGVSEVNAIMDADITTSNTCATAESPYTGTFIGNGHNLNIKIISEAHYRAPFTYVKDATFRDLRVKGTVIGRLHSAGLIGTTMGSSTVHIERVWVSANVTSHTDYVGGIIGHADVASIYMNDCRYDGTLTAHSDNSSYAGAIIGWSNSGGRWELHRVYDYNTWDEGSIKWISFSFNNGKSWGSNVWSTLTVTRYSWDNVNYHDKTNQTDVVNLMNGEKSGSWHLFGGVAAPVMETWPSADEVNFETYDMVPGTEKGEEGMLKIPFSCDQAVRYLDVTYVNENGQTKNLPTITYDKDTYAGFILVPATEKHTSLTITIKLKVGMVTKTVEDKKDAVLHHPVSLTTQLLKFGSGKPLTDAGAVQLTWKVNSADYNDVIEGDQFIVMRAFEDSVYAMKVIGSVFFKKGTTDYSFKDSLITADLTEAQLQGSSVTAYYKVMRAAAKELWGISDTVTSATKSQALSNLHLLKVTDYKADWKDQTARTISVNWSYGNEAGAVWDSRAQMKLILSSVNRNNEPVDTTTYVLTEQEMTARSKILTLPRSCVYYNLEFVTELGSTVVHYRPEDLLKDKNIAISSAADWATFVNMVNEAQGKYGINAWLMADISVTNMVGTDISKPFQGTFEGNGHTLTVNINKNVQCVAPFRYVGNATIRNLHTAGSVTTNDKFAAGLVSRVSDHLLVEGCHVSVDVSSSINGDATNGGIVGILREGASVVFRNCVFDGTFEGASCHSNGGFIGNINANGEAIIQNSLFAPKDIKTLLTNCDTWARHGSGGKLTFTNSYCTKEYKAATTSASDFPGYFVINSSEDWNTFCNKVEQAKENSDVNAVLNADITVTQAVGGYHYSYRGTFDGNGHTINMNINDSRDYLGLFDAKGYTIKNLRLTGNIDNGHQTCNGGLVGNSHSLNNGTNYILNCRVSATIKCMGNATGFVSFTVGGDKLYIKDCLFDGKVEATYGASSICHGYVDAVNDSEIYNFLEQGQYSGKIPTMITDSRNNIINCKTTNKTNIWSYQDWSDYCNVVGSMSVSDLAAKLGSNWKVEDGKAVPIMSQKELVAYGDVAGKTADEIVALLGSGWTKDASGNPVPKTTVSQPIYDDDTSSDQFYYENLGHIAKQSLEVENRPTSVLLTWENETDEPVDYYEVWRRDAKHPVDSIKCIATQLTEMQYEDKATSPVHQYIYKVRGVTSCEGLTYDETDEVEGMCYQTASVEGHLRFLDGTGIPAKRVFLSVAGKEMPDSTDESGFFRIEGIPYQNGQETSYSLSVVGINGLTPVPVTFGTKPGDNVVTGCVIEVGESVKLSGSVTYDGTSIPVQGVSFMVDGYEVHNASGRVTTDAEGNFAFRMLKGKHDSIQAVKDGHTFWRGGFYHAKDDDPDTQKAYDFQTDKAGLLFYDQTRVKLIGRVVGGNTQGELPLGHALSKNNLGDNLQLVFTLEGDNSSRLVFDKQDRNKNTRDEVFLHEQANRNDGKHKYQTSVHTTLNRMVVSPDPYTGEYELLLPPVKWKVQQITAKGYATLFQDGQVGDVIDLTDSITMHRDTLKGSWTTSGDHKELTTVEEVYQAKYSRIYHSPVSIEYRQQGFSKFDFFGDQYYLFKNLAGSKQKLTLAYGVKKENWPKGKKDSLETRYTFGYPVFSIEKKYPLWISATEKYYYNNNMQSDTIDVVSLPGGVVTIHNGMVDALHRDTVQLDSLGQGNYVMEIAQKPYLLTGDDALHTVTMTLLQDGTHYEAEPLKGYVFNILQPTGAQDIMSCSQPLLLDVLRDPPGGSSHATLAKGSTLKRAYTMDMAWKAGLTIGMNVGVALKTSTGLVVAPMGVGSYVSSGIDLAVGAESSINLAFSGSGERAFEYTMTTTEDISTSSDPKLVGADGDLYMGVVQNIEVRPGTAIRAIPDSTFQRSGGELKSGRMVEIARGVDHEGYPLHLVRDEVLTYGTTLRSNFVHSQHYIIHQLIPQLTEQCQSLMFTGTKEEAQMQANALGEPVYWSKVGRENEKFGVNYEMICPTNTSKKFEDEVHRYHQSLKTWIEMISRNEKAKMNATDLVANYDVDGGTTINYSESFQSDYSIMNSFVNPFTPITDGYFDNGLANAAALVGTLAANVIGLSNGTKASVEFKGMGANIEVNLSPVASFSVTPKHTESSSYSRTESFTVSMDKRSHLDFDVYRATSLSDPVPDYGSDDIFLSQDFWRQRSYVNAYLDREFKTSDFRYPTSFVYRTRGGATCRPWEGERKTLFNSAGTVLDVRTKKIENPQIKMDKQSLSGVPYGEPARFKLYITNESEQPEAAYIYFDLYQVDLKNPDGARLMIDGMPLTGTARTIEVRPGQVTEKTLEVYAGEKFDYEDLRIGVISQDDVDCYAEVAFDVHYLQTAGSVAILTPGDKWVLNTDAPQEKGKGWYLPVTIGGFDKNQHNFDHIEFQYKETNRGDDYWTNLCGYYADSTLYRAASGTKAMIPKNGNIQTRFFGEGQEMEKGYDLRAVLFCRNGNAFLTNESKVLSGVKDTRRPQLYGTPAPKTGVLGPGEDIIFDFSEDIEYNYLQKVTNFEVMGETNETAVQEAPSLQFGGNGYAQTQARRNFANKNVTVEVMIKTEEDGRDMPIFSHGSEGKSLQLWLTKERRLKVVVDGRELVSTAEVDTVGFQRVAMVLDGDNKQLSLYNNMQIGSWDDITYSGTGHLTFGAAEDATDGKEKFYKGRMLQGRLWYRTMDLATLNRYSGRLLTGYELGLADYYPMNDGTGDYAADLAQGAHLMLSGASWAQPEGMSLRIDSTETRKAGEYKGLQLRTDLFQRDDEQDYTLMFWFKTAGANGTLMANGSGKATDEGARNKFFIGFEGETLKYRTNGREFTLGDDLCNDAWHHYAMTVNRSRNVASIYIDNVAKAQLTTDTLGGMLGTRFFLGNTVYQENGKPEVKQENAYTGHIDGLMLFEQALPTTLIRRYSTKSPGGEERGLIAHMPFDHQVRQKSGELALQPSALSTRVKRDNDGNDTGKRDSVFVNSVDEVLAHIDRTMGAPVQPYEHLRNLDFSYVGRNNQLMVNIKEQDARINKQNVYVTLYDIPDKNGNFMKSPVTESFYVNRNPLTWMTLGKHRVITIPEGTGLTLVGIIENNGGKAHTYTIENLPSWITVDKTSDIVDAQTTDEVDFTISPDLAVGSYDQIIYLVDEDGMSDAYYLELTVEGAAPDWTVAPEMKRYSMNIVAQVFVNNDLVTDSRDIVGAFDGTGRCMGVNNIEYDPATGRSMLYMTVYDSTTVATQLTFRLWHYATGKTMKLTPTEFINFGDQAIVGTVDKPVSLYSEEEYLQKLDLARGWNWVSFNVYNQAFASVESILSRFPWQEGDILTEDSEDLTLTYRNGQWMSNSNTDISRIKLSQQYSYRVKVQQAQQIEIWGSAYKRQADRTIKVKQGWNSIGYTPMVSLPVKTALTDYFDEAMPGDVVKNQHTFAMFTADGKGGGEWLGTLKYMKPGEGYMLHRQGTTEAQFCYPYYEPGTTFIENSVNKAPQRGSNFSTTMSVVAEAVGIEMEDGDRLLAFAGGELVGDTQLQSLPVREGHEGGLFFLSIEGDVEAPLSFAIERGDEIIATTGEVMRYEADGISGSPAMPTQISFVTVDQLPKDGWYTLQGIKLQDAPTQSGVYIYNGKKQVIK